MICPDKKGVGLKPHEERTEAYREEGTMLDRRIVLTMKKLCFNMHFGFKASEIHYVLLNKFDILAFSLFWQ